jgi:hypothetical protein
MADVNVGTIVDAVSVDEDVSTPGLAMKTVMGYCSAMVTLINTDWLMSERIKSIRGRGVPLLGLILVPGSGAPDTFSIKDGGEDRPYLYYGAISAVTSFVLGGAYVNPFIDYSECTLSAGHSISFSWKKE